MSESEPTGQQEVYMAERVRRLIEADKRGQEWLEDSWNDVYMEAVVILRKLSLGMEHELDEEEVSYLKRMAIWGVQQNALGALQAPKMTDWGIVLVSQALRSSIKRMRTWGATEEMVGKIISEAAKRGMPIDVVD